MRRFSILIFCVASPALADIPTIDGTVLSQREDRGRKTSEIESVERTRYGASQSVTCSIYRPGRKNDPVDAARANPVIVGLARRIAREEGVDENEFLALVYQESRFNPCARSGAGAIGLAQLMPGTARELGVDPHDMEQNLRGGAEYYRKQLRRHNGDVALALAAYNAGPGSVQKYGGIPPYKETQGYVASITGKWLPAFGGSDTSTLPLNFGGGGAYERTRASTLNAMSLSTAIGEGAGDVVSWLRQLGQAGTGTVQDSWDHNSGARNANLELINRLIQLGTAVADLANSRNALTLGDLSGAARTTRYDDTAGDAGDTAGRLCDERPDMAWNDAARACVVRIDARAELLLETR